MNKVSKNVQNWIAVLIFINAVVVFTANSDQVGRFSEYSLAEPLSIASTWEAASRKELFVRLAQHYASGVSPNNAYYLGVIDSLYVRIMSAISGRDPVISDPAFTDPLLQWTLVIKGGLVCILIIIVSYVILNKTYHNPILLGILILLFINSSEVRARGFELKENLEMGVGIFLVFAYFLYIEEKNIQPGWVTGSWAGIIGLIKTPVLILSPILIRSVQSGVAFIITLAVLMVGAFRTSFDLSILLQIFMNWSSNRGTQGYTVFEIFLQNLKYVCSDFWYLLPLTVIGTALLIGKGNKKNVLQYLIIIAWFLMAVSSPHSEKRYYIGFTGIFLILSFLGVQRLVDEIVNRFGKKARKSIDIISVAIFSILFLFPFSPNNLSDFRRSFQGIYDYFSRGDVETYGSVTEILKAVQSGKKVYVDERMRVNAYAGPLYPFYTNERMEFIDPINDTRPLEKESILFSVCYPLNRMQEYGLQNLGIIETFIKNGNNTCSIDYNKFVKPHNQQYLPVSRPGTVIQIPIVKDSIGARVTKLKYGDSVNLPVTFFRIDGPFLQEWGSNITNMDFSRTDHFNIAKRLSFDPGIIKITGKLQSNYREKDTRLALYLNGRQTAVCGLSTKKRLYESSMLARTFGTQYSKWRNKYYPVDCELEIQVDEAGIYDLKFEIQTVEKLGSVRFDSFLFKHLG